MNSGFEPIAQHTLPAPVETESTVAITKALAEAYRICGELPGAFVSGSAILEGVTPNDVDIVVADMVWRTLGIKTAERYNLVQQSKDNEDNQYEEVFELMYTYRAGLINVLVVRDEYYSAYKGAMWQMLTHSSLFPTRDKRVWLHQKLKNRIRIWFDIPQKDNEDVGLDGKLPSIRFRDGDKQSVQTEG